MERARALQRERGARNGRDTNARAPARTLLKQLEPEARTLIESAAEAMTLSARAYHRVVRVARTIADLDDSPRVGPSHVSEALRYRPNLGGGS